MAAVAARYGETSASAYLLPLSVDGLIVVASICLVELTARITQAERPDLAVRPTPVPAIREEPGDGRGHDSDQEAPGTRPDLHDHNDTAPDQHEDEEEAGMGGEPPDTGPDDNGLDLADDLVPLLPAARAARDELLRESSTLSRDALAARLRRNGTAIRNTRVSDLLAALKAETRSENSSRSKTTA